MMGEQPKVGFVYTVRVINPDGTEDVSQRETIHNIMPYEGINHMLDVTLANAANHATWYIGLYSGNYTPVAADTMATFVASATELTTQYDEANRQEFVDGTIASGAVDNVGNEATFTFNTTASVRGGFIASAQAKAATTGVLLSAVKFGSTKSMTDGASLVVTAGFTIVS